MTFLGANHHYELPKVKTAVNWASQVYPMVEKMRMDDWIVKPYRSFHHNHWGLCL